GEDNRADLSTTPLNAISVVFTLDFETLPSWGPMYEEVTTPLFKWTGTADGSDATGYIERYFCDWGNSDIENIIQVTVPGNKSFGKKNISGYVKATIGYTYGINETGKFYITLMDANGQETDIFDFKGKITRESLTISNLIKGENISNLAVYDSVLDPDAIKAVMKNTADSPTIPEPATATLSLLALAGLAARRRRR
ncbi:MAG: PEP-CTERM sorting domain-containing protein, partial [Akkermansia sp.]|nr:PEP-CTERM sorting domain-containing protein [Akkermansia sp.]